MKRFLKWLLTVVMFRKIVAVLTVLLRKLGFKGLMVVGAVLWVVSFLMGRC